MESSPQQFSNLYKILHINENVPKPTNESVDYEIYDESLYVPFEFTIFNPSEAKFKNRCLGNVARVQGTIFNIVERSEFETPYQITLWVMNAIVSLYWHHCRPNRTGLITTSRNSPFKKRAKNQVRTGKLLILESKLKDAKKVLESIEDNLDDNFDIKKYNRKLESDIQSWLNFFYSIKAEFTCD